MLTLGFPLMAVSGTINSKGGGENEKMVWMAFCHKLRHLWGYHAALECKQVDSQRRLLGIGNISHRLESCP